MSTFLEHYPGCLGCPVSKYCGTMVGSIRLCNSYNDGIKESKHTLVLSKAPRARKELPEEDLTQIP
jgi:hypothetical protein